MSLICKYKARIQNLQKSEQIHCMLKHTLAKKSSFDINESNMLKSLERAISLQREDVNRLSGCISESPKSSAIELV